MQLHDPGVLDLLSDLSALAASAPEGEILEKAVARERERLSAPMRVAIVGLIKAGKSTLMNALLGAPILPTGLDETTYNVNWLAYGPEPRLVVYREGSDDGEVMPFSELDTLARRSSAAHVARDVRLIKIEYPAGILKDINLIDTPGLGSSHVVDSERTKSFLKTAVEASEQAVSEADAILYLFSRSLHEADHELLKAFQGATMARASPLNAVGVLTQVDRYWPDVEDPYAAGAKVCARLFAVPQVRQTLFRVLPVSGLVALQAVAAAPSDVSDLDELVRLPDAVFSRLTVSVQRFVSLEGADIPLPRERRRELIEALGLFLMARVRALVGSGRAQSTAVALDLLRAESGVPDVEAVLREHFGLRSRMIKARMAVERIRDLTFRMRAGASDPARRLGAEAAIRIEHFGVASLAFDAYDVQRSVVCGELPLNDGERDAIMRLTGDAGDGLAARLGLAESAGAAARQARALELSAHWRARAEESEMLARPEARQFHKIRRIAELCHELARGR